MCDDGTVCTWRSFLDQNGEPLQLHHVDKLAREIVRLHPVLRLRDARFIRRLRPNVLAERQIPDQAEVAQQLDDLTREMVRNPQKLSNSELRQGLNAMQLLLEHYFAEQGQQPQNSRRRKRHSDEVHGRQAWRSLENMNQMVAESGSRNMRLILLGLFSTLLQAKGAITLDPHARPLLLVEDPETRLHPIMLSVAWGLLNQLPLQKSPLPTRANCFRWCRLIAYVVWCASQTAWQPIVLARRGCHLKIAGGLPSTFDLIGHRHCLLVAGCWLRVKRRFGCSMSLRASAATISKRKGSRLLSLPSAVFVRW